jgi:hypothetical protein
MSDESVESLMYNLVPLAVFLSVGFACKLLVTLRAYVRDVEVSRLEVTNGTCCRTVASAATIERAPVRPVYYVEPIVSRVKIQHFTHLLDLSPSTRDPFLSRSVLTLLFEKWTRSPKHPLLEVK